MEERVTSDSVVRVVAAWILSVLVLLKLAGLAMDQGELANKFDGVTGFRLDSFMGGLAIVEAMVAIVVCRVSPIRAGQLLVLLGSGFCLYRWAQVITDAGSSCPCLGRLPSWVPLAGHYEGEILWSVSVWFVLAGLWVWLHRVYCSDHEVSTN